MLHFISFNGLHSSLVDDIQSLALEALLKLHTSSHQLRIVAPVWTGTTHRRVLLGRITKLVEPRKPLWTLFFSSQGDSIIVRPTILFGAITASLARRLEAYVSIRRSQIHMQKGAAFQRACGKTLLQRIFHRNGFFIATDFSYQKNSCCYKSNVQHPDTKSSSWNSTGIKRTIWLQSVQTRSSLKTTEASSNLMFFFLC